MKARKNIDVIFVFPIACEFQFTILKNIKTIQWGNFFRTETICL